MGSSKTRLLVRPCFWISRGTDLQSLIDEWQHEAHAHALSAQQAVVPLQTGRYGSGRKNLARLDFLDDVALPVFSQGYDAYTLSTGQSQPWCKLGRDAERATTAASSEWGTPCVTLTITVGLLGVLRVTQIQLIGLSFPRTNELHGSHVGSQWCATHHSTRNYGIETPTHHQVSRHSSTNFSN